MLSATRQILERLVGFDTVSDRPNLPLIDYVRVYLAEHGVEARVMPAEAEGKANLYARIGPAEGKAVGLSTHTDVVPVAGQEWSGDPFTLRERDGLLFGRGTCDMKGFLAVCLALVPDMLAAGLKRPIDLFLTHDEEVDCSGAERLGRDIGTALPVPYAVIVGEPTMMRVVDAHKSAREFFTDITGQAAHSALNHKGVCAITAAGRIIGEIAAIRRDLIARGDPSGRFDPPWSTIQIGTIHGGSAINIVPEHCRIHWEMRGLPGADTLEPVRRVTQFAQSKLLPAMREIAPMAAITTASGVFVPGFAAAPGSAAEQLAKRLARQNTSEAVSYITEAGYFEDAGAPAIVCGPGSIDQAHKADEYVAIEQLERCETFIERLIEELSA